MDADGSEFFDENKIKKSSRCCNSCLLRGAYENRTHDLLTASQTL